jgi:prepilin-type N-terminal cleavage/methylation domain-containing protein/prepilin-type processing-associated H-X9-DG protein
MRSRQRWLGGFTLLELLVVVGIVSILLVLSVSVARTARQSANRTLCVSNLRQIGMLIHSYTADNDAEIPAVYGYDEKGGLRPMACANLGVSDHGRHIGGMLLLLLPPMGMGKREYAANANIFVCPSDPADFGRRGPDDFVSASSSTSIRRMSYVYCYVPSGGNSYRWWDYSPQTGRSFGTGVWPQWEKGALTGFERHNLKQRNPAATAILWEPPVFHWIGWPRISFHSEGGHVLYLDGHVLDVARHELPAPSWPQAWTETTDKISILDREAGAS